LETLEWKFGVHKIRHRRDGLLEIWSHEGKEPAYKHIYRPPGRCITGPKPVLNLQTEVKALLPILKRVVHSFARQQRISGPKRAGLVTGIDLIYQWHQNGEPRIHVNFDTRVPHQVDGAWSHELFAIIERPNWSEPQSECRARGGGTLIDIRGRNHRIGEDYSEERVCAWFGEAMVTLLRQARDQGLFKRLSKAARCEIGVEDIDGHFGWPAYDDRGKANLI
jgi:hypothetical protein